MPNDKFEKIDEEIDPQKQQRQPGIEDDMNPKPIYDDKDYKGAEKLKGKTALITGGDSGIGRAVAVAFAKEGANIAIAYLDEHDDADETAKAVESYGSKCPEIRYRRQQSGKLQPADCGCDRRVRPIECSGQQCRQTISAG